MAMQNLHLAPEGDNDDLYSGYDYNDPLLDVSPMYNCYIIIVYCVSSTCSP